MAKPSKEWKGNFKQIVVDDLVNVFFKRIDQHAEFLSEGEGIFQDIEKIDFKDQDSFKELSHYKRSLFELTNQLPKNTLGSVEEEFKVFDESISEYVSTLPEKVKEIQIEERFKGQADDSFVLKTGKFFKRIGYGWSKIPEKASNIFRRIRSKDTKPLKPWYHEVHVVELANYFLNEKLRASFMPAVKHYYSWLAQSTLILWRHDEDVDHKIASLHKDLIIDQKKDTVFQPESEKIEALKAKIEEVLLAGFNKAWLEFEVNYEKSGTIEFPNSKTNQKEQKRLNSKISKEYQVLNNGWKNTVKALQDDWEIDLELYDLIYSSLAEYYTQKESSIVHKIKSNIFLKLDEISKFVESCKKKISATSDDKQLLSLLNKETDEIEAKLSSYIESNSENILNQDLPKSIDLIGGHIRSQISTVSTKRVVLKGSNYASPLKTSSLSYISPYELLNFECAPELFKTIENVKLKTTNYISNAQNTLLQLAEISTFNLESAVSAINENDDQEGKTIALTGLDRVIDQVNNIKEELLKIETELEDNLYRALNSFNTSIVKFTDNENILELRVRIMKGKATQRSKEIKNKIIENIKNLFPIIIRKGRMYYNQVKELIQGNLKRLGIGAEKQVITTELADFLAQTEEAIDQLPFVYQRLFRAVPLEDADFFEGRKQELKALINAYNHWGQKRFGATIVMGEKGGGISTLFNLFLLEPGLKKERVRISLDENIGTLGELLNVFNKALGWKIETLGELANKLRSSKERIIVLENLQRLYLKHVGGFDNIKYITELISVTNEKVYWLVGCTEFSYYYLDKTIKLSEDFGYTVQLESLAPETVVELIKRRHSVSGYNLAFEPSSEDVNSKRFTSLTPEAQQAYLKDEFFYELIKIAKSNISIALIYWLRSTKHSSSNTITISSLKDMDFSFMKSLSIEKLYVLHMLLLHDGLSEVEVSKVNNLTISQCRRILYPLFEDGIIIKSNGAYLINPLLYRQTINLLKTKNILH